ncbi:hypothetical protein FE236_09970, partial [Mariprofundus erugo]|uniref:hypothetical protein n=1 Tax=Mariprofundus erugo TaxID=2528639 RepID=UPI0010FD47CB
MNKSMRYLAIAVAALLLVIFFIVYISNDKAPEAPGPWKAATVSYDSECSGDCLKNIDEVADIETAHLKGVKVTVRKDVNDAIAQLGDCLDSIMDCVDESGDAAQTAGLSPYIAVNSGWLGGHLLSVSLGVTTHQRLRRESRWPITRLA